MKLINSLLLASALLASISTGFSEEQDTTIRLYTENFGHFNFSTQDREYEHKEKFIGGTSSELMKMVMKKSKLPYKIKLRAWSVAYERALINPYNGVFSTSRTESRENLFTWIGPIARMNTILYVKKGSTLQINSLADLDGLRVGGYKGDASTMNLIEKGVPVIQEAIDSINPKKLAENYIDVWVATDVNAVPTAIKEGYPDIQPALIIDSLDLYLAMNKNTPAEIIEKIEAAYQDVITEFGGL